MKITVCKVCEKNPGRRNVCKKCKETYPHVAVPLRKDGGGNPFIRSEFREKELKRIEKQNG